MDDRPDPRVVSDRTGRGEPGAIYSTSQIQHLMRVEFGRAQRYSYALSLMVVGVDDFERLRNRYGFEFAADVHDRVSRLVRGSTRACDHLGTLVDRRLLLVLPHTTREGATTLSRRLLTSVAELGVEAEGERVPLTASVGLTSFENANTMFFDDLLEAAEQAFESARAAGGARAEHRAPGGGVG